jgi:predicted lipoprotein with Yx(FWY)xxD motif
MARSSIRSPKPRRRRLAAGAALASLVALTATYGAGAASADTVSPLTPVVVTAAHGQNSGSGTITTVKTNLGEVLADSRGRTLYMLVADKNGKSSCSTSCLAVWPAATGTPKAGKGVTAKLGTTNKMGGGKIITADGHPLYTYTGDTGRAQTHGQGINNFGGLWWVLSPAGKPITKHAGSASPSASASPSTPGSY